MYDIMNAQLIHSISSNWRNRVVKCVSNRCHMGIYCVSMMGLAEYLRYVGSSIS